MAIGGLLDAPRASEILLPDPGGTGVAPRSGGAGRWSSRPAAVAGAVTAGRLVAGLVMAALIVKLHVLGPAPAVGGSHTVAGGFLHWDATWYRDITRWGYGGVPNRTSFFPLYPALVRMLTATGLPYAVAALGLSWVAFFFATWSVIELTGVLFPGARPVQAGMLFAWFPMSVFLLSGYAESVFAALVGWSFVLVARRRYAWAVALAALASAARPEGFLVGTAAVVALFLARRYKAALMAAVGSVGGLAAFSAYCWVHFGNPVEYMKVQGNWDRRTAVPFVIVVRNLHRLLTGTAPGGPDYHIGVLVEDLLLLAAGAAVVGLIRQARDRPELWPFLPFTTLALLLAASNATDGVFPDGAGRITLGLIPLFAFGAQARDRPWRALVGASCILAVMVEVLVNGGQTVL